MTDWTSPEILTAVASALAWICGGIAALVVFAWRAGRHVQRTLNVLTNHEMRIRRLERQGPDDNSGILHFPKNKLKP